jgi:hypothetical protein
LIVTGDRLVGPLPVEVLPVALGDLVGLSLILGPLHSQTFLAVAAVISLDKGVQIGSLSWTCSVS